MYGEITRPSGARPWAFNAASAPKPAAPMIRMAATSHRLSECRERRLGSRRPDHGREQADRGTGQHRARHAGQGQSNQRQQHAQGRPQEVRGVDEVPSPAADRQPRADADAAAEKGQRQDQVIERKVEELSAFPGDGIAIERQPVDRGISQQRARRETGAGQAVDVRAGCRRLAEAEEGAAGAEAEQRQAHHQEGEVVVLRHGQEPGQRAFKEERGRGQRRDAEACTAKHPLTLVRPVHHCGPKLSQG